MERLLGEQRVWYNFINLSNERRTMKKNIGKIASLLMAAFLLTGCGADAAPEGSSSREVSEESAVGEEAAAPVVELAAEFVPTKYDIVTAAPDNKVILDCDMTYLGDDAMCMCILTQADALCWIDLLGITITGGNTAVAAGTNAALNQLERIGRGDIPVYMGTDVPLEGFRDMEKQAEIVGRIDQWGVMFQQDKYVAPDCYHDLGSFYERSWGYSQTEPQSQDSVDFMIEQVHKYPGQVTIISTGAATNIALACEKDETFAENTAGIIYMAGAVEVKGSITDYAEFNCFYDAEAFEVCLRSNFPSQTIVPRDVAEQAVLNKAVFDLMDAKADTPVSDLWIENQYSLYKRNTSYKTSCTDAVTAAVFLNPGLVTIQQNRDMTVDANPESPTYGAVTTWKSGEGEEGSADVSIVFEIGTEQYWDFVTDVLCGTVKD